MDLLCFQEHKLRGARLDSLKDKIWAQATFYGQEASVGYNNLVDDVGAGCGGVCMWVAPGIQHLIVRHGHSNSGAA